MSPCQLGRLHARSAQACSHTASVTPLNSSTPAAAVLHRQQQLLPAVCGPQINSWHPLQQQERQHVAAAWHRSNCSSHHSTASSSMQLLHTPLLANSSSCCSRLPLRQSSFGSQRSYTEAAVAAAAAAQDQYLPEPDQPSSPQGTVTTVVEQPQPQQQQQDQAVQNQQAIQEQQAVQAQQYSPLHYDIQKFAKLIVPTDQETAERQRIIQW